MSTNKRHEPKIWVLTQREVIKGMLARWDKQYPNTDGSYTFGSGVKASDRRAQLHALDFDTCSAKDIDDIIGNTSWTELKCDLCGQSVLAVVGIDKRYSGSFTKICFDCLDVIYRFGLNIKRPEEPKKGRKLRK